MTYFIPLDNLDLFLKEHSQKTFIIKINLKLSEASLREIGNEYPVNYSILERSRNDYSPVETYNI